MQPLISKAVSKWDLIRWLWLNLSKSWEWKAEKSIFLIPFQPIRDFIDLIDDAVVTIALKAVLCTSDPTEGLPNLLTAWWHTQHDMFSQVKLELWINSDGEVVVCFCSADCIAFFSLSKRFRHAMKSTIAITYKCKAAPNSMKYKCTSDLSQFSDLLLAA